MDRSRLDVDRVVVLSTIAGFAVTIATSAIAIGYFFAEDEVAVALAYVVFVAFVMIVGRQFFPHKTPPPPPKTEHFEPFADPDVLRAWPRQELLTRLDDSIASSHLTVVVGPSGAGKTVLLHELERSRSNAGYRVAYIDRYRRLLETVRSEIEQHRHAAHIVIFDQFEQYLAVGDRQTRADKGAQLADLRALMESSPDVRFVVSVRSEWFYELRFLGDLLPEPNAWIGIDGITDLEAAVTYDTIKSRLALVSSEDSMPDLVIAELANEGPILPIKLQIVGAVLERDCRRKTIDEKYYRQLGGVNGAVERYFGDVLEAAPNRRVAMKTLLALSVRSRFRSNIRRPELARLLFEQPRHVERTYDYLVQERLISMGDGDQLAHDYVAEYFLRRSGSELDPVDRDNMTYHFEGGPADAASHIVSDRPAGLVSRFGRVMGVAIGLALVTRLAGFGLRLPLRWSSIEPLYVTPTKFIDVSYLPAFVSHAAWALYVFLFYERVLLHVIETRVARFFSALTVINMFLSIVAAMLWPEFWLVSIGWGGLVLAMKVVWLGRRQDVNPIAAKRLKEFGLKTAVNLGFVAAVGLVGALLTRSLIDEPADIEVWSTVCLLAAILPMHGALALAPGHVTQAAASSTLGLLARGGSGLAAAVPAKV